MRRSGIRIFCLCRNLIVFFFYFCWPWPMAHSFAINFVNCEYGCWALFPRCHGHIQINADFLCITFDLCHVSDWNACRWHFSASPLSSSLSGSIGCCFCVIIAYILLIPTPGTRARRISFCRLSRDAVIFDTQRFYFLISPPLNQ